MLRASITDVERILMERKALNLMTRLFLGQIKNFTTLCEIKGNLHSISISKDSLIFTDIDGTQYAMSYSHHCSYIEALCSTKFDGMQILKYKNNTKVWESIYVPIREVVKFTFQLKNFVL